MDEKTYAMLIHLSQFGGYITGGLGLVAPIILWVLGKNDSAHVDQHGRAVINWLICEFIYIIVSVVLMYCLIGIPIFFALVVMSIVCPILGALKAKDGNPYKYPLTFEIL